MSVSERKWTTRRGEAKSAWVVRYADTNGKWRLKTFRLKKKATEFDARTHVEVGEGTHVPDSTSATVAEAGQLWLKTAEGHGLEPTTINQYRQHVDLHIVPLIGRKRLSQLNVPVIRQFEDTLRENERSPSMVRYVIRSLGALIADAQERGLIVRNPARELRSKRKGPRERNGKLRVGVDIPTAEEISKFIDALTGSRWRPLLLTLIFTGLRASEVRGLRWSDVELDKARLHVRQRADTFLNIGKVKTETSERTIPLPPNVVNTLREWKLRCPRGPEGLVFPNTIGRVESHANIINRGLRPLMIAAGVTVRAVKDGKPVLDEDGEQVLAPKYTGLHTFRHFYASWCINQRADGGLELPIKVVQSRLGHASIMMTADRYGHLFPSQDSGEELAAAEKVLLAAHDTATTHGKKGQ